MATLGAGVGLPPPPPSRSFLLSSDSSLIRSLFLFCQGFWWGVCRMLLAKTAHRQQLRTLAGRKTPAPLPAQKTSPELTCCWSSSSKDRSGTKHGGISAAKFAVLSFKSVTLAFGWWFGLFHSQVQKVHSPNLPKEKCMSAVVRIGSIINFHLSKLWKAKFFTLCDVIFLVRLQDKFEIDHSWEWKG